MACEHAFAFLVDEFRYIQAPTSLNDGGLSTTYIGPVLGVRVGWLPGEEFSVVLAPLMGGEFPPPSELSSRHTYRRVRLGYLEAMAGEVRTADDVDRMYQLPTESSARWFAARLNQYGVLLLRGDLSAVPAIDAFIKASVRAEVIEFEGEDVARELGWL
jgi:hypothetical protein